QRASTSSDFSAVPAINLSNEHSTHQAAATERHDERGAPVVAVLGVVRGSVFGTTWRRTSARNEALPAMTAMWKTSWDPKTPGTIDGQWNSSQRAPSV